MDKKINLLINLADGFFQSESLAPIFQNLETWAEVQKTSCDTAEEILPHLRQADAVLMWSWPSLTPPMLDQCPNLRFCAHIDISQQNARVLLKRGVPVSLGRRGFSPAVAEMALTLILSALRRTSSHHAAMWGGQERWIKGFPSGIDPDERQLSGRKVGLIGFGGIGQRLAQLLAPFNCDLRVHDPYLPPGVAEQFKVQNVAVDDLVDHAEILVVCAAANAGTKHLLEARHIAALKRGAVLVNVCRASLIDYAALLARLQQGDIYAALDVFEREPLPLDSPWRALPNAYLSPHRAGGIMESVGRILQFLIDDTQSFFAGAERRHALTEAMISSLDA